MAKFYTNLSSGDTVTSIQNNGSQYNISISQDIDAKEVKAEDGFRSDDGSPVKITVSGSTITFTVVGVGSSTLTLTWSFNIINKLRQNL